jgi:hypothetical protein
MKRSTNKSNRKNSAGTFGRGLESLENRQLYSATPLDFYAVGSQLVCDLTAPSEQVSVVRSSNGIQFNVDGQLENVAGNFSYLSVVAQSGNNSIVIGPNMNIGVTVWGGSGTDLLSTGAYGTTLRAGSGMETLVALGSDDHMYGGAGYDNMWSNTSNYYASGSGTLVTHFFQSFLNTSDGNLDGRLIDEPGTNTTVTFDGTWANVSGNPLFVGSGPSMFDINQGASGDCFFMSGLGAIARVDPQQIRNSITALGDGTYAMEFYDNGTPEFIRVDGLLPVEDGHLFYANFGQSNGQGGAAIWAPLMEKGYAYFSSIIQGYSPDYAVPDQGGYGDIALSQLLGNSQGTYNLNNDYEYGQSYFDNNPALFAGWVNWEMQQGKVIEIGFDNGESDSQSPFSLNGILENGHEYTLASETVNSSGVITGFWVHNPWGVDVQDPTTGEDELAAAGHNCGVDNGLVWVSVDQAFSVMNDIGAAAV